MPQFVRRSVDSTERNVGTCQTRSATEAPTGKHPSSTANPSVPDISVDALEEELFGPDDGALHPTGSSTGYEDPARPAVNDEKTDVIKLVEFEPVEHVELDQSLVRYEGSPHTAHNILELTAFVHAALALGGPRMAATYSAEEIASRLVARDIDFVTVLEMILMDDGSARHLTDKLEDVAPFGLVALMKAHLQSNPLGKKPKTAVKESANEVLCKWGFTEQLTLDDLPQNVPLFDRSQECIMLPAYMAIVIKSLRNLHEQTETIDVGFTLVLRINFGGIAPELASELTDALQFRVNELPATFDPITTDAKWRKNLFVITSRMVRLALNGTTPSSQYLIPALCP